MKRPAVTLRTLFRRAKNEGWREYVRSEADERAMMNGCWFSRSRGQHVCDFFPRFLRHSKGSRFAGKPFELLDWQRDQLLMPLFGWVRRDEFGKTVRRFKKSYTEVPKKNGKSTLAAGVGLYGLIGDGEPGAEVYSAGCDRGQARIVFDEACNMVRVSDELQDMLRINNHIHRILYEDTKSYWAALSADSDSNQGKNAHFMIADELHAWYGRENFESLRWAFAVRDQSLFFMITTAPDDPQSVCTEQRNYAIGVNNGTILDDSYFGLIYAADENDDPWEESTWFKANPSLGVAIPLENFRADAEEAKQSPASIDAFKRYRLDLPSTGEHAAFNMVHWKKCGERKFDWDSLRGEQCYAGFDIAKTEDTTSLQLWFPLDDDDGALLSFFWLPEDAAREKNKLVSWLLWADEGYVELTPGDVTDFRWIKRKYVQLCETYSVQSLLYDPWQAEDITQQMEEETGVPRMAFPQTIKHFAAPFSNLERRMKMKRIFHQKNKVMDWQMGNVRAYTDPNCNKRPIKPKPEDFRKIDGPVAFLQALGGAGQPPENGPSIYESPDSERVCLL